jgi:hypothetical protein
MQGDALALQGIIFKGFPRNKLSILWGGQHERSKSGTGGDTHPTRKFGMFFYLQVPNSLQINERLYLVTFVWQWRSYIIGYQSIRFG